VADVAFHFNVPDKWHYACRLLRKAVGLDQRVWVLVPDSQCESLDRLLWTFSKVDFVAHARADALPEVLQFSPVVLAATAQAPPAAHAYDVLLNLESAMPHGFETFRRVIEVVSLEPQDKLDARVRWKHYQQAGCTITRHDLSAA
jgi:DNA polymerase-3 subunit chi